MSADAGIHRLTVPTPFAVGRVNCYLVDDDPLTLVDVGPNSGSSLTVLERELAEHGRRVEDLERIVLTHQHIDHIGLAQILAERSGAEVVALDRLAPWLERYGTQMEADDAYGEQMMVRHGVPPQVGLALRSVVQMARAWGAPVHVTQTVTDGGTLGFADRTWQVQHRPGHSPSDTLFFDAERRLLVGGDHLLPHISSNPTIARPLDEDPSVEDRPQALVGYLRSMRQTRELDVELVLPGHGDPFDGHVALIDERLRLHERRARKIAKLIAERPRTAHELATTMWGDIALTQTYLTLSEVLGHVDLLLNDGTVVEQDDDGVVRFHAVDAAAAAA